MGEREREGEGEREGERARGWKGGSISGLLSCLNRPRCTSGQLHCRYHKGQLAYVHPCM